MYRHSIGHRDGYDWIWSLDHRLAELLSAVPELVLGRVVAVTAFDSGPYRLNQAEVAAGWTRQGEIAVSPPITAVSDVTLGEWDEWYVFDEPPTLPELDVFVNFGNFTPDARRKLGSIDPTWDLLAAQGAVDQSNTQAERFWRQLLALRPVAFLAEGDALSCVVREGSGLDRVVEVVRKT